MVRAVFEALVYFFLGCFSGGSVYSPGRGWVRRSFPVSSLRVRARIFLLSMREKVAGGRMRVGAFSTKKRHDFRLAVSSLTLPYASRERVFSVPLQNLRVLRG